MGNHRFRLSDMIPNAWFYKLRDMSNKSKPNPKKKNQNQTKNIPSSSANVFGKSYISQHRQSYYYTREFSNNMNGYKINDSPLFDPPRRSRRRSRRKTIYRPSPKTECSVSKTEYSVSALCSCGAEHYGSVSNLLNSPTLELDSDAGDVPRSSFNGSGSCSSSCSCTFSSSATTDIVFDMNEKQSKFDGYDAVSELDLPPILTRPKPLAGKSRTGENSDEDAIGKSRKSFSRSSGVKLRANSPRIGRRKMQSRGRKSFSSPSPAAKNGFSGSFAVVKASIEPEKDFKESMMEMIVENNIKASKDLEELLACYLSLNSDEYHGIIIKAFQEIWFKLSDLHF